MCVHMGVDREPYSICTNAVLCEIAFVWMWRCGFNHGMVNIHSVAVDF